LRSYSAQVEAERNRAQQQLHVAEAERARADAALLDATSQRQRADSARDAAGQLRVEADAQRTAAERERDAAQASQRRAAVESERAQQTTAFLVDLFRTPGDATQVRGDTITARTLLERGAQRVRTELAAQPEVLAPLLGAIGTASGRLGLIGYTSLYDAELEALTRAYGPNDARLVEALERQGAVYFSERGFAEAAARYADAARLQRANRAPDSARASTLLRLGAALIFAERADSAERVLREALVLRGAFGEADNDRYAVLQSQLASLLRRQARLGEADSLLRNALVLKTTDSTRVQLLNNRASLLVSQQRFEEAEPLFRVAVAITRRIYPPTDRNRNTVANNYAGALARQGKNEQALRVLEEERVTHRAHFPPDHWRVGSAEGNVSVQLQRMGRVNDAIAPRERQVVIYRQSLGESHDWTLRAWLDLADVLQLAGRSDAAARERAEVATRAAAMANPAERSAILERLARHSGDETSTAHHDSNETNAQ
jgi:serine/threonine-protein kinase